MPKRICWKKGMRLTDEVLRASDNCTAEFISQTLSLAACGRFGLIHRFDFNDAESFGMPEHLHIFKAFERIGKDVALCFFIRVAAFGEDAVR